MTSVNWGVETEALHLRGPACEMVTPTETDDPREKPAVRAAHEQGFEPAPEAPLWTFLPAVWPSWARAWIPDTRLRHMQVSCNGEPARSVPWATADYVEMETDANQLLAACGLPARPAGRLWLLKPPHQIASLDAVLRWLVTSAKGAGLDVMATRAFVLQVRSDLDGLFAAGR